jgi:hypothetical protein
MKNFEYYLTFKFSFELLFWLRVTQTWRNFFIFNCQRFELTFD